MFKASRGSQGFSARSVNPHCPIWEGVGVYGSDWDSG